MSLNFYIFSTLGLIILVIPVLVNVAFVTLLERKLLGFSQIRMGPNKIAYLGIFQPFSDAIKLFIKQIETNYNVNWKLFLLSPVLMLILALTLWSVLPLNNSISKWPIMSITLLVVLSLGIYPLLISGWSSNSKYAMLGSIRGVAQTISYEISFALLVMQFILLLMSYNLKEHIFSGYILMLTLPFLSVMWLVMLLAETNRTPFDFSEGESELVSGFNIEYGSTGFVLIFLSEYAMILLFSSAAVSFFTPLYMFSLATSIMSVMISSVWIIMRATLPRYRYDMLMNMAWKSYLPLSLGMISCMTLLSIL